MSVAPGRALKKLHGKNRSFCAGAATPRFKGSLSHAGVAVQCAAARWRAAAVRGRGVGARRRSEGVAVAVLLGCWLLRFVFRTRLYRRFRAPRRSIAHRPGHAPIPRGKTRPRQNRNSHILSYSFVPPRARAHLSHGSSAQSPHTTHTAHDLGSVHSALALSS